MSSPPIVYRGIKHPEILAFLDNDYSESSILREHI